MSILINENTTYVIQGITGKEGQRATEFMLAAGSKIVGGVRFGKSGEEVKTVKVYDTVKEIVNNQSVDCSVVVVPPQFVKSAVVEAVDAGIKLIIPVAEGVPVHDTAWLIAYAKEKGARLIGPNTTGIISPGKSMAGLIGGRGSKSFSPGKVGIISRSGGMMSETARLLTKAGIGQSTCVAIGGDKIIGTDIVDCLKFFAEDQETKAIVLFGEIGGSYEEESADWIRETKFDKPVVAYISGKFAERWRGVPLGHAGAIIDGNKGTSKNKITSLSSVGVKVFDIHHQIVDAINKL